MKKKLYPDEEILNLLESIRNPDDLLNDQWLSSGLATRARKQDPELTDSQILRVILTPVLEQLRVEAPDLADLLHGRYWEGCTLQEMIDEKRPGGRQYAERSLRHQSNRARSRFSRLLAEQEELAVEQLKGVASERGQAEKGSSRERQIVTIGVTISLLGIIVSLLWVLNPFLYPSANQGDDSTALDSNLVCGEARRASAAGQPQFLRHQGVSSYSVENTSGLVHNNKVRVVAINKQGLWAGFFSSDSNSRNGLAQFNKLDWADCDDPEGTLNKDVNDIAFDRKGRVWVAAEKTGVSMYDGSSWRTFTEKDGLPSSDTFGLTVDPKGDVWVSTWAGVATFNETRWITPLTTQNGSLERDHAHTIAFDSVGDIWVGLIRNGVSRFRHTDGAWIHLSKDEGSLSGNEVRAILIRPHRESTPESVWIATADGGISVYEQGVWEHHTVDTGLPSNNINDLALDRYNRVWAATLTGVSYLAGSGTWTTYTTLPSLSVAFGPDCADCPYDSDHVLVGTLHHGITHSRIPLDTDAIEIVKVAYPKVVSPGQEFVPEITIAPKAPYKLTDARGDFLSNIDEDDALLFGTHEHMAVKGTIEPGAAFMFSEPNLPFIAPQLRDGVTEQSFTSSWRMWMHTRYVGPPIYITFIVRR